MSLQKLKKKKEKATSEGNLNDLYVSCFELATLYIGEEDYDSALKEFKEAKRAAEASQNVVDVARVHRAIADMYSSQQDHDQAVKHGLKHLELARSAENMVEEQRALANLGHMYLNRADSFSNPQSHDRLESLRQAKHYSLLSLKVCDRLVNVNKKELAEMQARLYLNLGLSVEQEDVPQAETFYYKAVNLCKSMDIWDILYQTYYSLGSMYQQQTPLEHTRALQCLDKALNCTTHLHDNQRTCLVLLVKAEVLFDLPDFRGAKQCLLKAYKLNTSNRDEVERKLRTVAAVSRCEEQLLNTPDCDLTTKKSLYETLGDGCALMKNYAKALEYYYLMLEIAKNMGETGDQLRPCYVSLSQTYKDNRQYDLALKYFREELHLVSDNALEACKTMVSIAEVLELKEADEEEVMEAWRRARQLAQEARSARYEVEALGAMVELLRSHHRLSEARKMEVELGNLKEKRGPLTSDSESEEEEGNTPDIGADINIDELTDDEPDNEASSNVRTRKRCLVTKFRRNEKGEFPLHTACISGNLTLVRKLLDQGHPVNVRDHSGWLPLHEACNYGYTDIVAELLDRGAAINDRGTETTDGMTPLLDAASNGNLDTVRLLLARGASPVMRTNKRETVLDCLVAWRKRYVRDEGRDLDPDTLEQFNDLLQELRTALKKAGQQPEREAKSPSPLPQPVPAVSASHSSHRSQVKGSKRQPESFRDRIQHHKPDKVQCSRRSLDVDDNLDEGESTSARRRSGDGATARWGPSHTSGVTREYEETMMALRRKQAPTAASQSPPRERAALVNAEEVVDEDWLVEDLPAARGVKRRRGHEFEGEALRRSTGAASYRPLSPVVPSDLYDSQPPRQGREGAADSEDCSALSDLVSLMDDQPEGSAQPTQRASRVDISTQQLPLTAFGVVQSSVAPPPPPTRQPLPPAPTAIVTATPTPSPQVLSVRVRVEGKLLLVPLPSGEPPTVAWLADEVARRYYSFEGVEPVLRLVTSDGALLAPHDPVTLLLSCPEVTGEVTRWKHHPATQRYRDACQQLGVDVDEWLERAVDISQSSSALSLAGCGLSAARLGPAMTALSHQTCLQHLLLQDNRLGDTGMQMVAQLVTRLPHLRELDLRCNGITVEGLTVLVQRVTEHQACKRIEVVRLCHNRLGRTCLAALSQLLASCLHIAELGLAGVGLTSTSFSALPFLRLSSVDVGYNSVGAQGVAALLSVLSVEHVESLRLAHCGAAVPLKVAQWLSSGTPSRLCSLDLAHCTDDLAAFSLLARCLEKAPHLERLEVSCASVELFLHLPLRVLRLPGVVVPPPHLPPPPTLQLSCLSISPHQPHWGLLGPRGLLTNAPPTSG